jgi:hypothetical protein
MDLDESVTYCLTFREEQKLRVLEHVMLGRYSYLCLKGKRYSRLETTALGGAPLFVLLFK